MMVVFEESVFVPFQRTGKVTFFVGMRERDSPKTVVETVACGAGTVRKGFPVVGRCLRSSGRGPQMFFTYDCFSYTKRPDADLPCRGDLRPERMVGCGVFPRLSFAELHADVHAVVRIGYRAECLCGRAAGESRDGADEFQQLVAFVQEADFASGLDDVRRHCAQTAEIGHLDGLLFRVERVVSADGASADFCGVGAVTVEREGAAAGLYAHFGQACVQLLFDFRGGHFASGLHEEVLRLEGAVCSDVFPCARQVALRQCGRVAEQVAYEAFEHGTGRASARYVRGGGRSVGASAGRCSAEQRSASRRSAGCEQQDGGHRCGCE